MNNSPYSNRELDAMFGGVHEKLDAILSQTTKHNGRMTKMEAWRNYIAGGIAAITMIGVPIAWYMFNTLHSVEASVIELNANGRIISGVSTSQIK